MMDCDNSALSKSNKLSTCCIRRFISKLIQLDIYLHNILSLVISYHSSFGYMDPVVDRFLITRLIIVF